MTVANLPPMISKQTAVARDNAAALSFKRDRASIGVGVTQCAQDLYNQFYKQYDCGQTSSLSRMPKDTYWHAPGETQDILVLGVRVSYPYAASNCFVDRAEGSKAFPRISNMVRPTDRPTYDDGLLGS